MHGGFQRCPRREVILEREADLPRDTTVAAVAIQLIINIDSIDSAGRSSSGG